jgi:hypothetical protein
MRHKIIICVGRSTDAPEIIKGASRTVRGRLLDLLFGEKVGVLVLTPGRTVETVEIRELPEGGEHDGENA